MSDTTRMPYLERLAAARQHLAQAEHLLVPECSDLVTGLRPTMAAIDTKIREGWTSAASAPLAST